MGFPVVFIWVGDTSTLLWRLSRCVTGSRVLDFKDLEYISSAGLGTLLSVQKRLMKVGDELKIINANKHIRDVFKYSGLSQVFDIHDAPGS